MLDGSAFKRVKEKFLPHVRALAKRFRKKMLKALRRLQAKGVLQMTDGASGTLMASLAGQDWNIDMPNYLTIRAAWRTIGINQSRRWSLSKTYWRMLANWPRDFPCEPTMPFISLPLERPDVCFAANSRAKSSSSHLMRPY
jgi:hypothetical protein